MGLLQTRARRATGSHLQGLLGPAVFSFISTALLDGGGGVRSIVFGLGWVRGAGSAVPWLPPTRHGLPGCLSPFASIVCGVRGRNMPSAVVRFRRSGGSSSLTNHPPAAAHGHLRTVSMGPVGSRAAVPGLGRDRALRIPWCCQCRAKGPHLGCRPLLGPGNLPPVVAGVRSGRRNPFVDN